MCDAVHARFLLFTYLWLCLSGVWGCVCVCVFACVCVCVCSVIYMNRRVAAAAVVVVAAAAAVVTQLVELTGSAEERAALKDQRERCVRLCASKT